MFHGRLPEERRGVALGDVEGTVRRGRGGGDGAGRVEVLRLTELVGKRLRLVHGTGDGLVLVVQVFRLLVRVLESREGRSIVRERGQQRAGVGGS